MDRLKQKVLKVSIMIGLICSLIMQPFMPGIGVLAESDSTPPVLESIEVSPQYVNVGDTVTFRIKANDDISGVRRVVVSYESPSKNLDKEIVLSYRATEDVWEGNFKIQSTDEGGVWSLQYIGLTDYADHLILYNEYRGTLPDKKLTDFTVNNEHGDAAPPVLESIEVSPQIANVGETVTFRVKAKDDISGIRRVVVSYESPSKNRDDEIVLNYRATEGIWEGTYTVQPTDEGGIWNLQYIGLTDYAGHLILYNEYRGTLPDENLTNFTINNTMGDSTPPVLESIEVTPQNVKVGETVTFRVKAKDDISGVRRVVVSYESPSKNREDEIVLSYRAAEGIWEGNYTVQATDEDGIWNLQYIGLTDYADHLILYNDYRGTLPAPDTTQFTINNAPLDITAPPVPLVNTVFDYFTNVTGSAEAKSTVSLKVGAKEIGSAVADENGNFIISVMPQKAGTILTLTATDKANNSSDPQYVTVLDGTIPVVPIVHDVTDKSTSVTGTAETGSIVTVQVGTQILGSIAVKEDGIFEVVIPVQKAGTMLLVSSTDQAGNKSESQEIIVKDATSPEKPVVNEVTDKSTSVMGTAEAGATISVQAGTEEIGTTSSGEDGRFVLEIPFQAADTKLTVTATDAAGNQSESLEVTVKDKTPPEVPIVTDVTDQTSIITGKAEAGSTVSVQNETREIGSSIVGEDGYFNISIPPQTVETKLIVKATDITGNQSNLQEIIVKSAAQPQKFTDITGHWAENEINKLYELGLVKGYTDGSFGVSNKITRAEVASIISRHLKLTGTPATFSDVQLNYWASNVIGAIQTNKIMSGYNDGTFKPNAPITRAEIASIIERAYDLKGEGAIGFTDVSSTHWAYKPISVLVFNNLTSGFSNNTFRPNAELSRSEFAAFLSRVISLNP